MDASSLEALVFDQSKCSKLSMEQKRELVYELSNWSDGATDILHSWSRQDILQLLCAELGKERKYTGLTKTKIIEQLLKIVYEKKGSSNGSQPTSENGERTPKRQKSTTTDTDSVNIVYCKNSACKAKMNGEDAFCKRCSCCICRQYDDNKDPSLWLICNSDPPFHGASCGMSCHLECALRHENSGISKDRLDKGLDGSFCCVYCRKVNDLLGSWKKQLVVARDTRRVDILCYRLSLAQKILAGTKQYQDLRGAIDEAVEKLEEDVGPLTGLPVKRARGIVNRLSSGPDIQRLCASAVENLDSLLSKRSPDMPSDCDELASRLIRLEDIRSLSATVVLNSDNPDMGNVICYMLWHRKADDLDYLVEPTCRLFIPNTKFLLSGLTPATDYFLKVVTFDKDREMGFYEVQFRTEKSTVDDMATEVERSQSPATNCSSLSNPSSFEDETNSSKKEDKAKKFVDININCPDSRQNEMNGGSISLLDEEHRNKDPMVEERSTDPGLECVPSEAHLQITPCKIDNIKEGSLRKNRQKFTGKGVENMPKRDGEPQAGSSSKKRNGERQDEDCTGIGDKDFEYYVKVIRWLECDGHIETTFRQKFLTWYSLRATSQEVRVVKVFIDMFMEDPESLAEQLVDTFSDVISNKRCSRVPSGFCLKFWH